MSKLLDQGGFGCVYYPGLKCDGKVNLSKNIVTKLQKKNFRAKNEIYLGELISKIKNYQLFFSPVIRACNINLANVDKNALSKCEIIDETKKVEYVIMDLIRINGEQFIDLIKKLSKKNLIITIFDTYKLLLDGITVLLQNNIVHFDIKSDNILYEKYTNQPIIIDFGISLPMEKITISNVEEYIYVYAPDYYIWPLDVHILSFLIHKTSGKLTQEDAIKIATDASEYNKSLDLYSDTFKHNYKLLSIEVASRYVGMERNKAIQALLDNYTTWDNYSLSVIYLKLFFYLFENKVKPKVPDLFVYFSQILSINISPDPRKRMSISETIRTFSEIFYSDETFENYVIFFNNFDYDKTTVSEKLKSEIDSLNSILNIRSIG
jgi:serine/threonine protein kinase